MPIYPSEHIYPAANIYPEAAGVASEVLRATITPETGASVAEIPSDPVAGNFVAFNNGVSVWLEFTNTTDSLQQVRIVVPFTVRGQQIPDFVVLIPAGARHRRGPFDTTLFSDRIAFVTSSADVTVAAWQTLPIR